MIHFADRVCAAVRTKGNALCVGLDPRWELLPAEVRDRHGGETLASVARAFEEFCGRVIDVVATLVPVVKPQMAFFEACGPAGFGALQRTLDKARRHGLLIVLDGKRNDIASTAVAYADAALAGVALSTARHPVWDADALTVNPYLGRDAVEPFLESARRAGRGIYLLVRTSNAGARQFQDLDCSGRPLYAHVADAVCGWSRENVGICGFGDVGAVVGATYPAEMAALREAMPQVHFLVPGFGAQGGGAADVKPAFRADRQGAIINSSRGILFASPPGTRDWEAAVERATRDTIRALEQATSS
jgi:orotidine-5'-phosphate decarboxylase